MCAVYRVAIQGWSKEDAMEEMRKGGYNFHEIWKNLPKWFNGLDFEDLKARVGIPAKP